MKEIGIKNPNAQLADLGIKQLKTVYWNLSAAELTEHALRLGQGELSDTGALCIKTGKFTGRSPKDRFIVKDELTASTVDWSSKFNEPFAPEKFERIYEKMRAYLQGRELFVQDGKVCADEQYGLRIRTIAEKPWSALFVRNMFMRPSAEELQSFEPDWTIIAAPDLLLDPETDGTRQENVALVNFTKQTILIAGTGYTGEMKKGIFGVLNFLLPHKHGVLPMHCSANMGDDGDVAIFFGLSGTGKTTLSADPSRALIGDDEHGWCDDGVFNFEGGCYAKAIKLSAEDEPQIFNAIRSGAILENTNFLPNSRTPDYYDSSITENTRVCYPLHFIDNALEPAKGGLPKNIFFLTCDAFGVLPPIAKLSKGQAMFHFISGYTAKVAGTEAGIKEPQQTFSACFGAPFLPLHPIQYADMLGERMEKHQTTIWLVNTGWSAGPYGVGSRMSLKYTRALIQAALSGELHKTDYTTMPIFGLETPTSCPGVPDEILTARNTWTDKEAYDKAATDLANKFIANFEQFKEKATEDILAALPQVPVKG